MRLSKYIDWVWGVLVLLLISCGGKGKDNTSSKPIITVTIEPIRYFTEVIAGDKYEIVSMVPKGAGPETYDPTPGQLIALEKSTAYFRIGYIGFEQTWMNKLQANAPEMQIFDTSVGLELIHAEGHFHGDHYHEGGVEPHIWNSPVNMKVIAHNITNALIELDAGNREQYIQRYDSVCNEIDHTDSIVRNILSEKANHVFMIYHPALSYFARDYNLIQIPIEKDGKEPSPSYLKKLIDVVRKEGVRIIFVQPEFTLRNAELIAKETNTAIVSINPLNYEWHQELINTAKALRHE